MQIRGREKTEQKRWTSSRGGEGRGGGVTDSANLHALPKPRLWLSTSAVNASGGGASSQ